MEDFGGLIFKRYTQVSPCYSDSLHMKDDFCRLDLIVFRSRIPLADKNLQLTTPKTTIFMPKCLVKLPLTTPIYAETTTVYEKVRGLEHVCN